jgi:hypothetical protein
MGDIKDSALPTSKSCFDRDFFLSRDAVVPVVCEKGIEVLLDVFSFEADEPELNEPY